MEKIKLFNTEQEYNKTNIKFPNVSYILDTKKLW